MVLTLAMQAELLGAGAYCGVWRVSLAAGPGAAHGCGASWVMMMLMLMLMLMMMMMMAGARASVCAGVEV